MIQVKSFVFNPLMEKTYVVYDETKQAIIIDPGCYEDYEAQQLDQFIAEQQLKVVRLINTHGHVDHVLGNYHVHQQYQVPLGIHKKDEPTLIAVKAYAPSYGFFNYQEVLPEYFFEEGERISFGQSYFDIFFVPGHSPGHVAFYNSDEKICIGGDVLFNGSIGRTDLPGGDFDTLIQSIHQKLFTLNNDTVVYPGHGPSTTIGQEKATNPFCAIGTTS